MPTSKDSQGTTISKEKAGLPCCESPVPAAKKLLVSLPSDGETPPEHELAIDTGTDELGPLHMSPVSEISPYLQIPCKNFDVFI